jgi:hypothetical protein
MTLMKAELQPLFRMMLAPQEKIEPLVERGVCIQSTDVSST